MASGRLSCLLLGLWLSLLVGPAARATEFSSTHYRYTYDERQLPRADAERAAQEAERAFAYNQGWFPGSGPELIRCDLTPRFYGATGYAQPDLRPPRIAVRIPDLDYLGLDQAYVLRHEVAHVFSGRLASGPMGEGLADLVAGGFGDLPLAPWWGRALREAGLWVDPEGLFVSGDYPASAELDTRQRVAQYTEPALLLQYLSSRYGFERLLEFLPEYGRARRSIESNETGARRRGFRRPDAEVVRRSFAPHFGRSWDELRTDWERQMTAANGPPADSRRLVIGQKTYAAIRNFEMWVLAHRDEATRERSRAVREAFTTVNEALRRRQFDEAEARLKLAQGLVNALKRPMLITRASLDPWPTSNWGGPDWKAAAVGTGKVMAP
jgi:hypothetical protein